MRPVLARLGLVAGVAALLGLGLLLAVLPGRGETRVHSVYSFEPQGLRALFLTLEGLGLPVRAWNATPDELPPEGTLLVLARRPEPPPPIPQELERAESGARTERARDLGHYAEFLERGGTMLFLGCDARTVDFLRDDLGLAGLEDLTADEHTPATEGPTGLVLGDGERIALPRGRLAVLESPGARVLARTEADEVIALARPQGRGRLALLAVASGRFSNEALQGDGASALLLVRLIEALGPFERVLFDEFALGGWRPDSVASLAFSPRLAVLTLQLLLLGAAFLLRTSWSGPFAREPEPWRVASPLARARAQGELLVRAERWDLLAERLRRGQLERWDARAGRRSASEAGAESASALEPRLRRLARGDAGRAARLRELFLERRPTDAASLEALDRDLCAFEAELFAELAEGARRSSARPHGPVATPS